MRLVVASVGRERQDGLDQLVETYRQRCPWPIELIEVPAQKHGPQERRLADEAAKLQRALPAGAVLVALDERGEALGSVAFAQRLQTAFGQGQTCLAFLIGGADGLAPELLEKARWRLAFGPMTWPHRLVRLMLLEQLYRASTIQSNHPYHRA